MNGTLSTAQRLFQPLNIAAYITWLAVLLSLFFDTSPGAPQGWQRHLAGALMLGFLLAFVALDFVERSERGWLQYTPITLMAALALALCALWYNNAAAPVLIIIVMVVCAMLLPAAALIGVALALNMLLWLIFDALWQTGQPWINVLIYGGFQAFAALTAWYARGAQESAAVLQQTNAHLLATRSLLEESARDQERLRLSRELHDVAGHKLTALKLNLSLLQLQCSTELRPQADVAARLASELLEDLRAVVAHLREHDGMDLRQALMQLAAPLPRPQVHLDLAEDVRVDNVAQAEALIRAAQEALTNVARHANASNAWVHVRREGDAIRLQVHDDGRGAAQLREGNGLTGMRERLAALGGSLQLSQAQSGGMAVDVTLPLRDR